MNRHEFLISYLIVALCLIHGDAFGQPTNVLVQFDSPDAGMLIPRMDSSNRKAIMNPPEGIMVYDLSLHGIFYFDGTNWNELDFGKQAGPFLGEVKLLSGPNVPDGWHVCDGSALLIAMHPELFAEIGTTYGGNENIFRLPDLRGRVPMGSGMGIGLKLRSLGDEVGEEATALTEAELPSHNHRMRANSNTANATSPLLNTLATGTANQYINAPANVVMSESTIGSAGSNVPHNNIQPSIVLQYIIYLGG